MKPETRFQEGAQFFRVSQDVSDYFFLRISSIIPDCPVLHIYVLILLCSTIFRFNQIEYLCIYIYVELRILY